MKLNHFFLFDLNSNESSGGFLNYFLKLTTNHFQICLKFGNDDFFFMIMDLGKKSVELNKPIYAG